MDDSEITLREKLVSSYRILRYRPTFAIGVIALSIVAAVFEGLGLTFIAPIVEQVQNGGGEAGSVGQAFAWIYGVLGIPYTLEFLVVGVSMVMAVRFGVTFLVHWLMSLLGSDYVRHLRERAFERTLAARVAYFDERGSDTVLNAIVTQAKYVQNVVQWYVYIVQQGTICLVYIGLSLYLAPWLTIVAAVLFGGLTLGVNHVFSSAYGIGDRLARANERLQTATQAGTQGIRDAKLFGMTQEVLSDFRDAAKSVVDYRVRIRRNEAAINNLYHFMTTVAVFVLIYLAVTLSTLPLANIGVFLFAMFRLGPKLSELNRHLYNVDGELPHLVRMHRFIDELDEEKEPKGPAEPAPDPVDQVAFDDIQFAYEDETVLQDVSFAVDRGEFVAFVGPSGAGKSTIVALLARMYEADEGTIYVNDSPIEEIDLSDWRDQVAVVRQNPFIFNETLRYNVTIGNRDASQEELEHACEVAGVTEYLEELPNGYETVLGDDGVRLSGGQRQRISIARALLKDADVLVLDEATSALDSELESRIHHGIFSLQRDHLLIVIAHRLSTVTDAERIYTIESGRITEAGSHEELLSNDGRYAQLYATQS